MKNIKWIFLSNDWNKNKICIEKIIINIKFKKINKFAGFIKNHYSDMKVSCAK